MDIVEVLKKLIPNTNADALLPVINLLRENSFDLKKVAQSLTPEKIAPIIETFSKSAERAAETRKAEHANGVAPIANVANKEIIYTLNRYLSTETAVSVTFPTLKPPVAALSKYII